MSETTTIIWLMLATAGVTFLWSTIPALWGKVFTFATAALTAATAAAVLTTTISSDTLTMVSVLSLMIVATALANMLRVGRKPVNI